MKYKILQKLNESKSLNIDYYNDTVKYISYKDNVVYYIQKEAILPFFTKYFCGAYIMNDSKNNIRYKISKKEYNNTFKVAEDLFKNYTSKEYDVLKKIIHNN